MYINKHILPNQLVKFILDNFYFRVPRQQCLSFFVCLYATDANCGLY